MHQGEAVAWVRSPQTLKEVVIAMTATPSARRVWWTTEKMLQGLITDGDLRRAFQKYDDIRTVQSRRHHVQTANLRPSGRPVERGPATHGGPPLAKSPSFPLLMMKHAASA